MPAAGAGLPAVAVAEGEPYVPFQGSWNSRPQANYGDTGADDFARPMQWNTAGAWLLAFSQIIFLVIGILFAVFDSAAIVALQGSGANNLLVYTTIGAEIGLWILMLLFAAMDRRKLRSMGYLQTASIWWMLVFPVAPLLYLILRGVAVSREVRRGWGPLIAYLVTSGVIVLLSIAASIAIPLFLSAHGGSSVTSSEFAAGIQKGLDEQGGNYTVTCPPSISITVGNTFSCTALDSAGTSHSLNISIVLGSDGKPTPKLLSVSPPITN